MLCSRRDDPAARLRVAAAAACGTPGSTHESLLNRERIAILGAGPMGLAAAYQIVRDGGRPVVFEADDRVGGMAASFELGGLEVERFYHFHSDEDRGLHRMLGELAMQDHSRWAETRMGIFHHGRVRPWGDPLSLARLPGIALVAKLRYGLHAISALRRRDLSALDNLTAAEWIRRSAGSEAWRTLWQPLLERKLGRHAEEVSAAWVCSRVRRAARMHSGLTRRRTYYLRWGTAPVLAAVRSVIERAGGEVRLSAPVTEVRIDRGRVEGVRTPAGFEPFEKVISTVPLPVLPGLAPNLPAAVRSRFEGLSYLGVVCVVVRLRRALTDYFWLNVLDPLPVDERANEAAHPGRPSIPVPRGLEVAGVIEFSRLRPSRDHLVYVPFYLATDTPEYGQPDPVFAATVRRSLSRLSPGMAPEDILEIRVFRYQHAQPICPPAFLLRLPPLSPVRGLWAADTSRYYPADRGLSESFDWGRKLARLAASA
jgi:protoporphyrinogen oxidase